jgi:hypothetical protein
MIVIGRRAYLSLFNGQIGQCILAKDRPGVEIGCVEAALATLAALERQAPNMRGNSIIVVFNGQDKDKSS